MRQSKAGRLHAPLRAAAVCTLLRAAALYTLLLSALVVALPAGASATRPSARSRPGVAAPAVSAAAVSAGLQRAAGVTSAQVAAQDVCGSVTPGTVSCDAQRLVLRSDGRPVRPRVHARATFSQVFPSASSAIASQASGSSASSQPSAFTPAYLQQAYDLTYLSQTAGVGDTVAIVDAYDDPSAESDLATFRSEYGLPACTTANGCFEKINEDGAASPLPATDELWETEEALDTDAVSALCPNCHILLVEAASDANADLVTAEQTAAQIGANQISDSWSGDSGFAASQFTFPGVAVVASSGDTGYIAGGVSYPASYPDVTAAGGTALTLDTDGSGGRGFSESAWGLNGDVSTGTAGSSGCNTAEPRPSYQPDAGCDGRAFADLSADADPHTGLLVYDTAGGWQLLGGTSLASPLIAAYEAVTGVDGSTPQWAYSDSPLLNDPTSGSNGTCPSTMLYICNAGVGYDGPTGIGSISGAVITGAPGVGGPSVQASAASDSQAGYATDPTSSSATLVGGLYPNGLATSYYWQYGTSASYGQQTAPVSVGAGTTPVSTTDTLTGLTPSTPYHYRMVATNADGTTYGYDSVLTTSQAAALPPVNTLAPAITGTDTDGQQLTVSQGTWSPAAVGYSYQWQRSTDGGLSWTAIAGATGTTYTLGDADVGALISVAVTATNSAGSTVADTAADGPITDGAPVNTLAPAIAGAASDGQQLTVSQGTWSPAAAGYSYQWQRSTDGGLSWTAITGATGTAHTLADADVGALISVAVTATNSVAGTTANAAPIGPVVGGPPVDTALPAISGIDAREQQLTVSDGTWNPAAASYSYQWQRWSNNSSWTAIAGATNASYTPAAADVGTFLRAVVTASNSGGSTAADTTPEGPVASGAPVVAAAPLITGTAERALTLAAFAGTWSPAAVSYAYHWQRSANSGATWATINGARGSSYTPAAGDEGALLRVSVTATNTYGTGTAVSSAVGPVAKDLPVTTVAPAITGTAQRAGKLTGSKGTWTGAITRYSYRWQHSADGVGWTSIPSATAAAYTATAADEGDSLRLQVTAATSDGTAVAVSAAIGPVTRDPPVNTVAPKVTGTLQRTGRLIGAAGSWSAASGYAYQWQRSADGVSWTSIPSATAKTYVVAQADEGDGLRLLVTATNVDGSVSAASATLGPALASLPVSKAAPRVTGTVQRGSTLTGSDGSWWGGDAYACQWQRSTGGGVWTSIPSATASTYTITAPDEGDRLRLLVTASNLDGGAGAPSAPTRTVTGSPPDDVVAPTITEAASGGPLTASQGTWKGADNVYAYQWQGATGDDAWADIPSATSPALTVVSADLGSDLRVLVTASNPDGTATVSSDPTQAAVGSGGAPGS